MEKCNTLETKLTIDGNVYDAVVQYYYTPEELPTGAYGELASSRIAYPGYPEELEIITVMLEMGDNVRALLASDWYESKVAAQVLEVIHATSD